MTDTAETAGPALLQNLPEADLRKLAVHIAERRVFGTWNIAEHDVDLLSVIFIPLGLGARIPSNTGHLYEYYDKAADRGINGYPSFFSCKLISEDDARALFPLVNEYRDRQEAFLSPT